MRTQNLISLVLQRDCVSLSANIVVIFLFTTSASAMFTLESKGVVHRDLKPQNLLLHHSGNVFPSPSEIQVKIGELCANIDHFNLYTLTSIALPSSEKG